MGAVVWRLSRADKFCWGWRKFSNSHCDLIQLHIFFILISLNIEVLLIVHRKFPPKTEEKVDFHGFTIFSIGDHLGFSTRVRSYKNVFMLNSAEHEILSAQKYNKRTIVVLYRSPETLLPIIWARRPS